MQAADPNRVYHPLRATFAKALCFFTIGLIFAGGIVTSKNVGLAVPDWPNSFGYHMWGMPFSMWKAGVLYEHLHRVLASIAGLLVLVIAVWLLCVERRVWLRRLALACLVVVVLQGLLGGITVLLVLPTPVSVMHGVLAQLFLCLTIALAYALSRERVIRVQEGDTDGDPRFARAAFWLVALVGVQLVVAAAMRHDMKHQGGVAVPDFPTVAGRWLPAFGGDTADWVNAWRADAVWEHAARFDLTTPVRPAQIALHVAHRLIALLLVALAVWLTLDARRRRRRAAPLFRTLVAIDALILFQIVLGAFVIWSNKGELITTLHVAVGAAVLGLSVLLALRALPAGPARLPRAAEAA